jgi:all-trans-retinol 13,14-reductase
MKFQSVKKRENSFTGKRDKSYYDFKQECAEKVFSLVSQFDNEIINAIDYYETSSPLTYRDYTYTAMGSTYGIMHNADNIAESYIPHKTKIPNLLLTGQNINTHGMLGVTIGSIITCSSLIDYNTLIKDITNSTNHTNEI